MPIKFLMPPSPDFQILLRPRTNTYTADIMYLVKNAHLETVQFFEKSVDVSKILTFLMSQRRHFRLLEKKSVNSPGYKRPPEA